MMPLTESLPNGPASTVAGGSHVRGPDRTNVERGAGAASAGAGGAACAAAGVVAGAGVDAESCAPARRAVAMAAEAMICRMRVGLEYIGTYPPGRTVL